LKFTRESSGPASNGPQQVNPGSGRDRKAVAATRRFNSSQALGALLLIALSSIGAVLLLGQRDTQVQVWELARDVSAGTQIQAGDVVAVEIPADARVLTIPATIDATSLAATVDIPAGTLLNEGMVDAAGDDLSGVSQARVALVLEPDQHPSGVAPGDTLRVFELPVDGIAELGLERRDEPYVVKVFSIEPSPGQSNRAWVTVIVALDEAQRLSTVSSLGLITSIKVG